MTEPSSAATHAAIGITTLTPDGPPAVRHYVITPEVAEQVAAMLGEPDETWLLSDEQASTAADVADEAVKW